MRGNHHTALPRPLDVEAGFAAARDSLRKYKRENDPDATGEADLVYFEGMAAVEEAVAAAGTGEDAEPAPAAIRQAVEMLSEAARKFHEQTRPAEEALAGLQTARALVRIRSDAEAHRDAVGHLRSALEILDTASHPALAFDAFLLLGNTLHTLTSARDETDREGQLRRALACAEAAEYLGGILETPMHRARQKRLTALILADRFRPGRDENLLDAIAKAGEALSYYEADPARDPLEYGTLHLAVGNAWLKVTRDRADALKQACDAFRAGLAGIDPKSLPRLAQVLAGNLAMTEQLIQTRDHLLPEKEMVGRFDAEIHECVETGRLLEAIQRAWAFMHWAWALPNAPNIHVGAAHKFLGSLYFRNGDMADAEMHLYSSLAVFSAVLRPGQPDFSLVEQTRQDLGKCLEATDQKKKISAAIAQAERAVSAADGLVRRAAERMEKEPSAALADFEEALRILPTSPDALFYRGVVHMLTGHDSAAQADFSTALMFRPRHIPSLGNRFTVRLRLGDRDGALADCDAILEIDPEHDGALHHRAELRSSKLDWDGAIADLDRFLKIHPGNTHSLILRAAAKEQKRDIAGSIADVEQAMDSNTDPESQEKLKAKIRELRTLAEE